MFFRPDPENSPNSIFGIGPDPVSSGQKINVLPALLQKLVGDCFLILGREILREIWIFSGPTKYPKDPPVLKTLRIVNLLSVVNSLRR